VAAGQTEALEKCQGVAGAGEGGPSFSRLTPAEIEALPSTGGGTGTSGLQAIRTRVLYGNPDQAGLYTIRLTIPRRVRIEAHSHPDERVATVISGTWSFCFGNRHEENRLKALPEGSFYTEPANELHSARTGERPVVLEITGVGPTATTYLD